MNYGYNVGQRPISAVDSNNINFAANAHYTAWGALSSVVNAKTSSFAGIATTNSYDARTQPVFLSATSPTQTVMSLGYDFNYGQYDNGDVYQVINNKDSSRSVQFWYDFLDRLGYAGTSHSANWGTTYSYDAWGNLLQRSKNNGSMGTEPLLNVSVNGRNQVTNWCYDTAGNVIDPNQGCPNSPPSSYPNVYDAENRLARSTIGASTTSYDYGADGQRVKKLGNVNTLYWYGPGGVLEETDLSGNLQNEYVFFGGKRTARVDSSGAVHYYFTDHLGSANVVTAANGSIEDESDYYPFGGEQVVNNSQVTDVINPGFEQITNIPVLSSGFEGGSSQGWVLGYSGANSVVTNAQAHSGSYSLAQSGATAGGSFQDVSGLAPGASYQVSVWVRADAGTTAQMYLWLHDTTGANAESTAAITPGQSWQQVTLTYVANSTGKVRIHLGYVAGAGTIYYDDVQVVVSNAAQGWALGYWGATSVVTSTQAHSGSYSLAQSGATTGGSFQDVSVTAGASYQVSVWVKADAGTTAQMYLWLHDTTGANAENTAAITPGQSWQQVTLTYVANSTGQLRIHLHYVAGAGTIYYDDVQVTTLNPPGNLNFANHYKFTGKERDPETGCDYFGARYYCNPIGRFITPDWAAKPTSVPYANFGNPQSLNLYSYVQNNPTTMGDPDGHRCPGCPVMTGPITVQDIMFTGKAAAKGLWNGFVGLTNTVNGLINAGSNIVVGKDVIGYATPIPYNNTPEAVIGTLAPFGVPGGEFGEATTATQLADDAIVVRGGIPTAEQLTKGAETINADGTLNGVSVQSANGATVEQLAQGGTVPKYNKIGTTTVGEIRATGGDVVPTPRDGNPCHCDMNNVNAQAASQKFKVQPNPAKVKVTPSTDTDTD